MRIFAKEVTLRSQIGARYTELLKDADCITPYIPVGNTHVYAQYSLRVKNRDEFIHKLSAKNIPTAIHYRIPLHLQPCLEKYYNNQDLSCSKQLSKQIVSLPMHPYLDETTQNTITEVVKESL